MNSEQLSSLIIRLYTGATNDTEHILGSHVVFCDPLVVVKGRTAVLSMFGTVHRLFPKAKVLELECIEHTIEQSRWTLCMNYRGDSRKMIFGRGVIHTELVIQCSSAGQIKNIIEHWKKPLNIKGNIQNPPLKAIRRFMGLGFGLRFPRQPK